MNAKPSYSYVGRLSCGCVVAAVGDYGNKFTAESVAKFIQQGLSVERVTDDFVRDNFIDIEDCPHRTHTKQLPLIEGQP